MAPRFLLIVAFHLTALLYAAPAAAGEISGPAHVIDGDTIAIAGQRLHLSGIFAPPLNQICTRDQRPWRCGEAAAFALAALIEHHWLTCRTQSEPSTAICHMGGAKGIDIAQAMVRRGWAKTQLGSTYGDLEQAAKQAGRGLWAAQ